jgi:uncharacterized membrane protein YuzA (DUF378 family)
MDRLALIIVIVGAINWLLVGFFQWDLVAAIFGGDYTRESSMISRVVYALVGIAGLFSIRFLFRSVRPVA